jgi:hypothetical protein
MQLCVTTDGCKLMHGMMRMEERNLVDKTPGLNLFDAGPAIDYQQIATTHLQRYKQGRLITSRGDPVPIVSVLSEPSTPNSSVDE